MPISAVVFDFDGVLADSEILHLSAYQQVLAPLGVDLTRADYFARYLGFDDEGVFREVGAEHGWRLDRARIDELIARKTEAFAALEAGADVLFPGAAACIIRLAAEFPLGIASGAQRHEIEAALARADLRRCFAFIVASGDTKSSKPAPDPYRLAAELHGRSAASCVAVEDSRWGIESATAAGLACIGITQSYPRSELTSADIVIDSLDELTAALIRGVRGE